ncbi:probable 1-acylglycerol-3-phosphate O-acyltransferase isoform X4 [Vicia villosa]|uniref:probable 1-acylglycerol-3-phosphate O-acyltransferase isoform X4 n=1 Tax=Vicia villosa TaxID=3911 RepID=UPI00273CC174|nr:probable 1-acylglycerol-3-phosphate O-acyltransferase isoform X4 [Vicia villosa]
MTVASSSKSRSFWSSLRWILTSTDHIHIIVTEKRILSIVNDEPRFINTVTFDSKPDSPMLVMVHGYAASQGFFFRNFDALASRFGTIAVDQLGWGGSSRPNFTCRNTEETEAWFIDSFKEWRKAKSLSNFILFGHSFGGYVAAKYARSSTLSMYIT